MTPSAVHRPFRVGPIVVYALLVIASVIYLTPVLVQLITGLKSFQEVSMSTMWKLPTRFSLQSYARAWSGAYQGLNGLSVNFMNSVYLTVPATLISAFLGSMNGYVLAKWKFRGANILFPMLLFGMFIPYQSILIPLVRVLQNMHLYSTRGGLIFVHVVYGIPITTLIFRNYYAAIPDELIEAAKITAGRDPGHLREHPVPPFPSRFRGGHDLAVHLHLERFPLCRDHHRRAVPAAHHGGPQQPGRELLRGVERPDGGRPDCRPSNAPGLHLPEQVLHERSPGRLGEGLTGAGAPRRIYINSLTWAPVCSILRSWSHANCFSPPCTGHRTIPGTTTFPPSRWTRSHGVFSLTRAEARGVASYYSLFSLRPRGRHVIRVCVSPICRMVGSMDLVEVFEQELGVAMGGTTADGLFTLEETQCLGCCAGAPGNDD